MKIRTRLLLLLGSLLVLFGLAGTLLRIAQKREAEVIKASIRKERQDLLDRLLQLRGQSLSEFVRDYSLWGEMVAFVQSGDRDWAVINIDASLVNFNAQAAWVLLPDGPIHYVTTAPGNQDLIALLPQEPAFLERLRAQSALHFFAASPAGIVEFRTAPILPSEDVQRRQTPRGWFVVARRWDGTNLRSLAESLQGQVSLVPLPVALPSTIRLEHAVNDWRGNHLATLYFSYPSTTLAALLEGNRDDTVLLYCFGGANILAVVLGVSLWLIRPLQQLGQSLTSGQREPLTDLLGRSDEFGDLSRQLVHSFIQRDALQQSEARLLQSIELRARLARDLHDGIIQSIYAAGLGLEGLTRLRATDAATADQRLASCQQMLNETLWQVRSFIGALEPESGPRQTTSQSIAALVSSMQALQSVPIFIDLDQAAVARIGPTLEVQLLQILRELLSNALRHSSARSIRVSLQSRPDDWIALTVADDGVGFDPTQSSTSGRGLYNLTTRTREIRGQLDIDSHPGKGARITILFRPIP
jgi:signal transduction histidine kinase